MASPDEQLDGCLGCKGASGRRAEVAGSVFTANWLRFARFGSRLVHRLGPGWSGDELEGFALLLGGRASPRKCPGPVPPVLGCERGCRCGGLACAGDHLLRCVEQSAASRVGERNDPVRLDSVSGSQARPGADPGDWWTRLAELAEGREITSSARPPVKI